MGAGPWILWMRLGPHIAWAKPRPRLAQTGLDSKTPLDLWYHIESRDCQDAFEILD